MGQTAELDARPGGNFRVQVLPGHTARGRFVELDPPRRLVYTWGWEPERRRAERRPAGLDHRRDRAGAGRRRDARALLASRPALCRGQALAHRGLGSLPAAAGHGRAGDRAGPRPVARPERLNYPPAMAERMLVEVWSDLICPWCYLGKRRLEQALERFPHRDGVDVVWRSFELEPDAPRIAESRADLLVTRYGMTAEAAAERDAQMTALAAEAASTTAPTWCCSATRSTPTGCCTPPVRPASRPRSRSGCCGVLHRRAGAHRHGHAGRAGRRGRPRCRRHPRGARRRELRRRRPR